MTQLEHGLVAKTEAYDFAMYLVVVRRGLKQWMNSG